MYVDKELELSAAQAVTTSAVSTNVVDLKANNQNPAIHGRNPAIVVTVNVAATAAGAATVTFEVQTGATTALGTIISATQAYGKAVLTVGREAIIIPIPHGITEQYLGLNYNVGTGPLTAGSFTAQIVDDIQSWQSKADAL